MKVEAVKQYIPVIQRHEKKTEENSTSPIHPNYVPLGNYCANKADKSHFMANFMLNFQGIDRAPEHFALKKTFGLNCPCCGQLMLTKKQKNSFITKVGDKRGEELRKELIKGYKFYRPNEEEIVNVLIEDSEKNPEMDLKALVQLEARGSKSRLEAEQKKILRKMSKEAEALSQKNRIEVKIIVQNAYRAIKREDDETFFQRKPFVAEIEKIKATSESAQKTLDSIHDIAEKMPNSLTSKDAFFVKYARRENKDIAARLCAPAMVTTEHICPQSMNGKDNTENYIPLCSDCNSKRGNMPYNEWFLEHPEMPENLQKYIDTIFEKIQNKEIENDTEINEEYLKEVIKAVAKATNGELALKMPEIQAPPPEKIETKVEEKPLTLDEQREDWLQEYNRLLGLSGELKAIYEKIKDDPEFHNIIEYTIKANKLKAASSVRKHFQAEFSAAKKKEGQAQRNLEAVLKDRKRKIDETPEAEERVRLTKEAADKAEDCYKKASQDYTKAKEEFEAIKAKVSTPAYLMGKITETRRNIEEFHNLKTKIEKLKIEISPEEDFIILLGQINSSISDFTIQSENLLQTFDINSDDSKEDMQKYKEYKAQLSVLSNVDDKVFSRAFPRAEIEPGFILEDSKEAAKKRMEELIEKSPAARYLSLQDTIETLNNQKAGVNQELSKIEESKGELKKANLSLKKYKGDMSIESLQAKLERLTERKKEVELKFDSIDIEDRIKNIEQKAEDILQRYCESFEV